MIKRFTIILIPILLCLSSQTRALIEQFSHSIRIHGVHSIVFTVIRKGEEEMGQPRSSSLINDGLRPGSFSRLEAVLAASLSRSRQEPLPR